MNPGAPSQKPSRPETSRCFALDAQNSIVVIANQAIHEEVKKILENLDRRRPQVLIEVAILQVTGDDSLESGVDILFKNGNGSIAGGVGSGQAGGSAFPTPPDLPNFSGARSGISRRTRSPR